MVQRVARAQVTVGSDRVAAIAAGLLIYLGVGPDDNPQVARHLAKRLALLRVFPDPEARMNRSLLEAGGEALVVSQFTLFADNRRGHRPSFASAAPPEQGRELCKVFADELRQLGVARVEEGRFGAQMVVESRNDGPVTIVATNSEGAWAADCG